MIFPPHALRPLTVVAGCPRYRRIVPDAHSAAAVLTRARTA